LTEKKVSAGLQPDGKFFVARARDEAASWRSIYKAPIPGSSLADRMGAYVQLYTVTNAVRPFGISALIAGWDSELDLPVDGQVGSGPSVGAGGKKENIKRGGPFLYMVEPSGTFWGYYAAAAGKGRQSAKSELEKLKLGAANDDCISLLEGVKEAARIIYVAHEDNKDKEFELEMTWISNATGPTKGRHQHVPKDILDEAERLAKKSLEGDDDDDDTSNNNNNNNEQGEKMQE